MTSRIYFEYWKKYFDLIYAIFEKSKKYQTLRMGTNYISFVKARDLENLKI